MKQIKLVFAHLKAQLFKGMIPNFQHHWQKTDIFIKPEICHILLSMA